MRSRPKPLTPQQRANAIGRGAAAVGEIGVAAMMLGATTSTSAELPNAADPELAAWAIAHSGALSRAANTIMQAQQALQVAVAAHSANAET